MSLRDWPPSRIVLVWLAWPMCVVLVLFAVATFITWRAERRPLQPGVVLPPQYSDFSIHVSSVPAALAFWCGPPLLLTLVWFWLRSRRSAR